MKGNATDVSIDPNITYSLKTNSFNKPLKLVNQSTHIYVFKIKTNQKTVVSLHVTHDFLMPNSTRQIAIKLADKPTETSALKLQFNYALASEQDIANKDSKMTSYSKESIFKKVITIERKDDVQTEDKQANKTQKIEVQSFDKNFSSPVKIASSIRESPKYPSVELTQSEAAKISSPKLDKSEEIDISELIKMQKSTEIHVPKQEEAPAKIEPPKEAPKKIELASEALNLKKTQSIESPQKETKPSMLPTNLLESSRDYGAFVTMRGPESNDNTFRMTESVIVDVPAETVSQKNEKQIVLSELNEKIQKQKRTIKTLRAGSQKQLSVYPLPLILAIIIGSFCLGSVLNWTVHSI